MTEKESTAGRALLDHRRKLQNQFTRTAVRLTSVLVMLGLVWTGAAPLGAQQPPAAAGAAVLVGLRPGASLRVSSQGVMASDGALAQTVRALSVQSADAVFHMVAGSGRVSVAGVASPIDLRAVYRLRLPAGASLAAALSTLRANSAVVYAEPDAIAHLITAPNDPLYAGQWGLAQIGAPSAWTVVTGSASVVIAVIDSGLDTTHPDLAGQLWTNPGETPGNGIDDDNDGYVDDIHGWDILNNDANLSDNNGHGTEVAGVAAAATNNGAGVAGVCWTCKLMVVKVAQPSGVANYSDIAAGVAYAAQKGAKVINLSLGGNSDSITLRAAVSAAATTAVVVGGAGNDNSSALFYPAAYPDVLAVAGTTISDTKVAGSNFGSWVDVSAPGEIITTTFDGGSYGASSGTSLAAPFAAGLAGLLFSQHPDWSPAEVRAQIIHTAHNIDAQNPTYAGQLGSGRIDAAQAVATTPTPLVRFVNYAVGGQTSGTLKTGATVSVTVTLRNDWRDASSVSAVLASSNGSVSVTKSSASWGAITSGQSAANSADPFQVTVNAGAFGLSIPLTLDIAADGLHSVIAFTPTTESMVQTIVSPIASDATWTSDRIWLATTNVIVNTGVTLTIRPGTVVKFNIGKALLVNGTLIADGTPASRIRFTSNAVSPAPGDWGGQGTCSPAGIDFTSNSQPTQYDGNGNYLAGSIIRNTIIEYGQGIAIAGGAPFIDSNLIQENGGIGSSVITDCRLDQTPVISHNWIISNTNTAVFIDGPATVRQNLIADNQGGGIRFNGGGAPGGAVISNTITGNGQMQCGIGSNGTICFGLDSLNLPRFNNNNIFGNRGAYDVALFGGAGQVITATNNYWGSTDPAAIRARIYDSGQDINLGTLSTAPFLTQPEPSAPAFVTQLLLSPASPVGIQHVTFNLSFSGPMDQALGPTVTFASSRRGALSQYTPSNSGLPTNNVSTIAADIDGSLWLGDNNNPSSGVSHFDGTRWISFNTSNSGLPSNTIYKLVVDQKGVKWIATAAGLARFDGSSWTVYTTTATGLHLNTVGDMAFDPDGSLWLTTFGQGVIHFSGSTWTVYNSTNAPFTDNGFVSVAVQKNGTKWFGQTGGAWRFDGIHWVLDSTFDHVSAIAVDRDDTVWLAGYLGQGIGHFDGAHWTTYNTSNSSLPSNTIGTIVVDAMGNKWFGSWSGGLARFDGTNWKVYDLTTLGFAQNSVAGLAIQADTIAMLVPNDGLGVFWGGKEYSIVNNSQWLNDHTWQGTYDITSLVPRDVYGLTVSGAQQTDGMAIYPKINFTFTVDYAGTVTDQTPPNLPLVFADSANGNAGYVTAHWSATDANSPIIHYRYAIGSAPGAVDVVNWTTINTPAMTRTGLGLVNGKHYWVSVQAQNQGGLWSAIGAGEFTAGAKNPTLFLPVLMR